MPKVSVIIPCYNQGQYLDESVDSVLSQSYQDFEIIIVNDGSNDHFTINLLNSYNKPKTKVIHTTNQGLASARNNGIEIAEGEYILPLDADDRIGPEYLENAVDVLDRNPGIGIVYCMAEVLGKVGVTWGLPDFSIERMLLDNIIFCSAFFRRSAWKEVGGYDPNMIYGWEDYDFWLSLIEKGALVYKIPKVMFYYRDLSDSMVRSKTDEQKITMFRRVYFKHQELFHEHIDTWIRKIIGAQNQYRAKLYLDTGLGFNEQQHISHLATQETRALRFDLSGFSGLKTLRFDPVDDYCVIRMQKITIQDHIQSYELKNYQSNASFIDKHHFIFGNADPHFIFELDIPDILSFTVNFEFIAIGKDTLYYFARYNHKEAASKDQKIAEQKQKIEKQKLQIEQTESEIREADQRIARYGSDTRHLKERLESEIAFRKAITNSVYWKLTLPLRKTSVLLQKGWHRFVAVIYHLNRQYRRLKFSGLFDADYYSDRYADVKQSGKNPLVHYMAVGGRLNRFPCHLFDPIYYLKNNPDMAETDQNPFVHYVFTGYRENRDPSPLFDTQYYLLQNPDLKASDLNPLWHYLKTDAGLKSNPNYLFDTAHYLAQNPELMETRENPLIHYLRTGYQTGKNPNPLFDSSYYLQTYPDINEKGLTPLEDYIISGANQGRNPHPLFDSAYYLRQNRLVLTSGLNPLIHYLVFGMREGRNPNPKIGKMHHFPKFSIITPVFNIDENLLRQCISSALYQVYCNLELCLVDDGSLEPHVKAVLNEYASQDRRVVVKFLNQNQGIAEASNEAVKLARGEFLCFLDHDDVLKPNALYEAALLINQADVDIIYTDESIIDAQGRYIGGHFKPDYSPDLLLMHNYITHLTIIRKKLFNKIGGFSSEYEGAQDYDLILKATEQTSKIFHIPKELYHWRSVPTSSAANPENKSYADDAGKRALEAALQRNKIDAEVCTTNLRFYYRVRRKLKTKPLISIIIPFRDESDYLNQCVQAILSNSSYQNYEIIGINNRSEKPETREMIQRLKNTDGRIVFYDYDIPFNYSKINNYAISLVHGEHIVLMNNDIEIINPDWIEALLEHSQREEVGAVGAKLYFPDGRIQHAGVIIGMGGFAGHAHKFFPKDSPGYLNRLACIQNVSAVTGALLMVKKSLYEAVDGLDEVNFTVALNDVDFCLKLREKGLLNIFTPYCEAYHYESISRGYENTLFKYERSEQEINYFKERWKEILKTGDPYFSPETVAAVT